MRRLTLSAPQYYLGSLHLTLLRLSGFQPSIEFLCLFCSQLNLNRFPTHPQNQAYIAYFCKQLLAILGWLHVLSPYLILLFVFLIGIGFAVNAPAWTSSVSEVVSNTELPSAAPAGGLQLNISGIIGPALGGLLVAWIGPTFVFALNAACFLVVILAVLQWRRTTRHSRAGLEDFFAGFLGVSAP